MPTQNVNLTDVQAEFIRESVSAGEYNNASELVREALRLLQAQKDDQKVRLQLLRAEIQKGYDAYERGDYIELNSKEDFQALKDEMRRSRLARMASVVDERTSTQ